MQRLAVQRKLMKPFYSGVMLLNCALFTLGSLSGMAPPIILHFSIDSATVVIKSGLKDGIFHWNAFF